jgi:hypothetical protein
MKINVQIECTPEEARAAMGLPDLSPVHERYIQMMMETIEKGPAPELLETMTKAWMPMGEAGMNFWRKLLEASTPR